MSARSGGGPRQPRAPHGPPGRAHAARRARGGDPSCPEALALPGGLFGRAGLHGPARRRRAGGAPGREAPGASSGDPGVPGAPATRSGAGSGEEIVRLLATSHWERRSITDELDFIGPLARAMLRRHGPFVPANAHVFLPMLELTGSGALVTGVGGDDALGPRRAAWLAERRERPSGARPRDIARAAYFLAPRSLRRARARRRLTATEHVPGSGRTPCASWLAPPRRRPPVSPCAGARACAGSPRAGTWR